MGAQAEVNDATWLHTFYDTIFWTTPGGDFSPTISATTPVSTVNTTYTWSGSGLLADVQAWVSNPASNFGWVIRANEIDAGSAQRLNTRENTSNPPQLMVTYQVSSATPTPSPTPTGTPTPTATGDSNLNGNNDPWGYSNRNRDANRDADAFSRPQHFGKHLDAFARGNRKQRAYWRIYHHWHASEEDYLTRDWAFSFLLVPRSPGRSDSRVA